ncbi:MAG: aminotransferase [Actinomycetota bacterium]
MKLSPRATSVPHSPIGAATARLADRTDPRPLLNLSQAAPSFAPPPEVTRRLAELAGEPDGARYMPQPGLPSLREAVADDLSAAYDARLETADVLITNGCNQAFCVTISALAGPGDNVVLVLPFYFNHDMWLQVEQIEARHCRPSDGMIPTVDDLAMHLDDRTRAVVLVSPGNPSGAIVPPSRLREIGELARRHDMALVIDETYRGYRGTGAPAHDLFRDDDWREHVISLHSFSKDLAIPGYRVGAVVAGSAVTTEALKILDCVAICTSSTGQHAAEAGLRHAGQWRRAQADRILGIQHRFETMMAERPGGYVLVSAGAYFGWVRHPFDESTEQVVQRLAVDHGVLAIPGVAFTPTDDGMIRFSFANMEADDVAVLRDRLEESA